MTYAFVKRTGVWAWVVLCWSVQKYLQKEKSFALAMADDQRLYEQTGYSLLPRSNTAFLAIDELKSHSVIERDLSEIFMVKCLSDKQCPEGKFDLLGYLF